MFEVHELVDCMGRDVFVLCGDVDADADRLVRRLDLDRCRAHSVGVVIDLRDAAIDDAASRALDAVTSELRSTGLPVELFDPAHASPG